MTDYALEAEGLRVTRRDLAVLRDLTFRVGSSQIVGLVGPSGCGKTTLMRTMAGVQRFAGGLSVLGRGAGDPLLRKQIGYSAQSGATYQDLSVEENVRYFASVRGVESNDADRVLDEVDLTSLRRRVVGRLSGGQRARVSLAIALLGSPRLLILDEPTVGLDPVLREQLWQLFRGLAGKGITLLVSSHVMDEAERCDELLVLRDGELLAQGAPAELERRTSTSGMNDAFLALVSTKTEAA
jgi:ABC-2 type transport system ATP-binding protein